MESLKPDVYYDDIFKAAQQSDLAFRKISTSDSNNQRVISRIAALFTEPLRSKPQSIITLNDIRDDYEQFRVWAKNIGVFAAGQASLDFRLRDAIDIRDGFVSLLEGLNSELINCVQLLEGDPPDALDVSHDDCSTGSSSESDQSSSSNTKAASATRRTASEIQIRFRHVGAIVDKLIRLAGVIRGSATNSRATKAANFVHYEDGVNWTDQFENLYLPFVLKHRFKLEEPLLSRFKRAISLRRRRFVYQAKHQKLLAYGGEMEEEVAPLPTSTRKITIPELSAIPTTIPVNQTVLQIPSLRSTPTKATTFQISTTKLKAPSRIVSASTKSQMDATDIPPPPNISDRATHFQCPYCCMLIPRQTASPKQWKNHIIEDLQPWICLEPDCPDPDIPLATHNDWLKHQRWEHAMEWWCNGEDSDHAIAKFSTAEGYAEHLRVTCNCSDLQSIEKKVAIAGRPSLTPFSCCPFCDFLPQDRMQPTINQNADPVATAITYQKELQQHIINELLGIFLIALPDRCDLQDCQNEMDSATDGCGSTGFLSERSLDFDDSNESSNRHLAQDRAQVLTQPIAELESLCDPALSDALWRLVWESPEMQNSVRKTYKPEDDRILRSFFSPDATRMPTEQTYTIAWLTTRQYEYMTASQLFDEIHFFSATPTLETYTLGRIGRHYVVLGCALSEESPQVSPLDVLMFNAVRDFPSIQLFILVGTGRGKPTYEHRVALGDVAVGFQGINNHAEVFLNVDDEVPSIMLPSAFLVAPPGFATRAIQQIQSNHTSHYGTSHNLLKHDSDAVVSPINSPLRLGDGSYEANPKLDAYGKVVVSNTSISLDANKTYTEDTSFGNVGPLPVQVTSEWSPREQKILPALTQHFGRDHNAIAGFLNTKSPAMVKEYFTRKVQNGRFELENLADLADKRRAKGEPSDGTPTPVRPPKQSHEASPATTAIRRPVLSVTDLYSMASYPPSVHYGMIASTNATLYYTRQIDSLMDDCNIICFEETTNRVNSQVPCVLVRGLREWWTRGESDGLENYAARTAAIYAKELTSTMEIPTTGKLEPLTNIKRDNDYSAVLAFEGMSDFYESISIAQSLTGRWLCESTQYLMWLNGTENQFLRIEGTRGAGKSTVMKGIVLHESKRNELHDASSCAVVSFFFNPNSWGLQNSLMGMYRSLLSQLFRTFQSLQHRLKGKLGPILGKQALSSISQVQIIESAFCAVIKELRQHSILFFIDGVNSCLELRCFSEPANVLVEKFIEAGFGLTNKHRLCYSSSSSFDMGFNSGLVWKPVPILSISINQQEQHVLNISAYVNEKLDSFVDMTGDQKSVLLIQLGGSFMWTTILINMLQALGHGPPWISAVHRILENPLSWLTEHRYKSPSQAHIKIIWLLLHHNIVGVNQLMHHELIWLVHLAVTNRNIQMLRILLHNKTFLRIDDSFLLVCDALDSSDDIRELIFACPGVDVNARTRFDKTILMQSIEDQNRDRTAKLLAHSKTEINTVDYYGQTALMHAVRQDDSELVHLFLSRPSIEVNIKDKQGFTALGQAIVHSSMGSLCIMLDRPDVEISLYADDAASRAVLAIVSEARFPVDLRSRLQELDKRCREKTGT